MATNTTTIPSSKETAWTYQEIPGAVLLGGILQSFLLGFVFGQASKYFSDFQDDSLRKKIFVGVVVLLSLFQTIVEDYKVWIMTVEHARWSNDAFAWSGVFVNGCISWLCEMFFIRRCWKMTDKNPWILYPLGSLAIAIKIVNIYLLVNLALIIANFDQVNEVLKGMQILKPSMELAFTLWIAGSLFLDLAVALILTVVLWRSKTGSKGSDQVVHSVIAITLESAALPCLSMIAAVCLCYSNSEANVVLTLIILSGKLYSFGLLRTLNARDGFRRRFKSHDLGRVTLGNWQWEHAESANAAGMEPFKTGPPNSISSDSPRSSLASTTAFEVGRRYPDNVGSPEESTAVASGVDPKSPDTKFDSNMDYFERGMSRNRNLSASHH